MFSKLDAQHAVTQLFPKSTVAVIRYTMVNAKVASVVYTLDGRKCSRFLSVASIIKSKMIRTVERAREVTFTRLDTTTLDAFTATGHRVRSNARMCSCKSYNEGDTRVGSQKVCKHTIAYAKQFLNIQSLNQFSKHLGA